MGPVGCWWEMFSFDGKLWQSFLATLGNEIFNLLKFPCNSWKQFVQRCWILDENRAVCNCVPRVSRDFEFFKIILRY
jgi:hypothetical protein